MPMKKINEEKQEEKVTGEIVAQAADYMYYSKLLQKPFNSLSELQEAESEVRKVEQEKLETANAKKSAAKQVEDAIRARIEAQQEARKTKAEAYRSYLEICENADKLVESKVDEEKEKLKLFCEKYGSFHSTIKIGDITYNCDYSTENRVDPFIKFLNGFWN